MKLKLSPTPKWDRVELNYNFAYDTLPLKWLEDTFPVGCFWVAGLSGTKTKLNSS